MSPLTRDVCGVCGGDGSTCGDCPPGSDVDSDGVCSDVDLCPFVSDPLQVDEDSDGFGDACDGCPNDPDNDADGDCVCADEDVCPGFDDSLDSDGDTIPDGCDACAGGIASGDTDANGIIDLAEFANFASCAVGPNAGLGSGCECFDFDSDSHVSLSDFSEFQRVLNSP
ncbi:MAG: hypothetical protein DHS20C16_06510 [Phycisphaerae bacterium]|nr:MAG: hypothetical protein DHS20C16_06510 [Phycisphaerae bacterium]